MIAARSFGCPVAPAKAGVYTNIENDAEIGLGSSLRWNDEIGN
ncbi:MAG: hypothetical protein ACI9TB_002510 [Parasphingorhabdus sp.]|jgi:hypothetical protein